MKSEWRGKSWYRRGSATALSYRRDTVPYNNDLIEIAASEVVTDALVAARVRRAERFLKGPILMRDIATAARLSGQALALFLAVHHRTALTRKSTVTLPRDLMAQLGVSRDAKARGLRQLEASGLIRVERATGRAAKVTLVCADNPEVAQRAPLRPTALPRYGRINNAEVQTRMVTWRGPKSAPCYVWTEAEYS